MMLQASKKQIVDPHQHATATTKRQRVYIPEHSLTLKIGASSVGTPSRCLGGRSLRFASGACQYPAVLIAGEPLTLQVRFCCRILRAVSNGAACSTLSAAISHDE
jgi:hypothetical protein